MKSIFLIIFTLCLLGSIPLARAADSSVQTTRPESHWSLLAGYGATHTNLGKTKAHVETVDLVLGYERFLSKTFGPSFLNGRYSTVIELPVSFVVDPWESPIYAINFLARWTFSSQGDIEPYLFGGGGPVYTDAHIPGLGSNLNGNWQFGTGIHFGGANRRQFILEYRFHHISNLGRKDPNDPLNSSKILFGTRF